MANEEIMEKTMTEDELEQVAGGVKVMVITYLKDGTINGYHGDFRGDIDKLESLAKGGKVKSMTAGLSLGLMKGIKKEFVAQLIAKYRKNGYRIIESRET